MQPSNLGLRSLVPLNRSLPNNLYRLPILKSRFVVPVRSGTVRDSLVKLFISARLYDHDVLNGAVAINFEREDSRPKGRKIISLDCRK